MESENSLMSSLSPPESPSSSACESIASREDGPEDQHSTRPMTLRKRPRKRPRPSCAAAAAAAVKNPDDSDSKRNLLENIPQIGLDFNIVSKIGDGTFSSVHLATLKEDGTCKFAIKHLVPTSLSQRMENEVYCLEKMGGAGHVISLCGYVRCEDHVALIMPYFKHNKFVDCLPLMGVAEVRLYMQALCEALRHIHSHKIIHRDIKPSNFLYNRTTRKYQLVDFGLAHLEKQTKEDRGSILKAKQNKKTSPLSGIIPRAQPQSSTAMSSSTRKPHAVQSFKKQTQRTVSKSVQHPLRVKPGLSAARKTSLTTSSATCLSGRQGGERGGKESLRICPLRHEVTRVCKLCMERSNQVAPRAGTPGFRAPEVLLKHPHQTTAVDMWSVGVILLCLLSGRYPFFKVHDDMSAMAQIVALFGSQKCIEAAKSYGKIFIYEPEVSPVDLKALCVSLRASMVSVDRDAVSCDQTRRKSNTSSQKIRGVTDHKSCCINEDGPSPVKRHRLNSSSTSLEPIPYTCSNSEDIGGADVETHSYAWNHIPESAYELMCRCLDLNSLSRVTAEQALSHEFLTGKPNHNL